MKVWTLHSVLWPSAFAMPMLLIGIGLVVEQYAGDGTASWPPLIVVGAASIALARLTRVGIVLRHDGSADIRSYLRTQRHPPGAIRGFGAGDYQGPVWNMLGDNHSSIMVSFADGHYRPVPTVSGRYGRIDDMAKMMNQWLADPSRPLDRSRPDRSSYRARRSADR